MDSPGRLSARCAVALGDAHDEWAHDRRRFAQHIVLELAYREPRVRDRADGRAVAVAAVPDALLDAVQPVMIALTSFTIGMDPEISLSPEPGTLALGIVGAITLFTFRRRK